MTTEPLRPVGLRAVLGTTATLHVLTFGDGATHREVCRALAGRRHPTRHACHVSDYFEAESALWRARPGDHVLLVGSAESLGDGLLAARSRGFDDDRITLLPYAETRGPLLCDRCAGRDPGGGRSDGGEDPGSGPSCAGCDLGMPGVA